VSPVRAGELGSAALRLPAPDTFRLAERGLVALGGCLMPGEEAAFACRSCELERGRDSDPTADEAELVGLLGVGYPDVVRALGTGWRREAAAGADGVEWFVSGELAQVAIRVQGPWFVLARPVGGWGERRPGPLTDDGPLFTREDVLHDPYRVPRPLRTSPPPAAELSVGVAPVAGPLRRRGSSPPRARASSACRSSPIRMSDPFPAGRRRRTGAVGLVGRERTGSARNRRFRPPAVSWSAAPVPLGRRPAASAKEPS
jgi:hypothetical protein